MDAASDEEIFDLGLEAENRIITKQKERSKTQISQMKQATFLVLAIVFCYLFISPQKRGDRGQKLIAVSNAEKKRIEEKIQFLEISLDALKGKAQQSEFSFQKLKSDWAASEHYIEELLSKISRLEMQQTIINGTITSYSSEVSEIQVLHANCSSQVSIAEMKIPPLDTTGLDELKAQINGLGAELAKLKSDPNSQHAKYSSVADRILKSAKELHGKIGALQSAQASPIAPTPDIPATATATTTLSTGVDVSVPVDCPAVDCPAPDCSGSLRQLAREHEAAMAAAEQKALKSGEECAARVQAGITETNERAAELLDECSNRLAQVTEDLRTSEDSLYTMQTQARENRSIRRSASKTNFADRSAGSTIDYTSTSQTYIAPNWQLRNIAENFLHSRGIGRTVTAWLPLGAVESHALQLASFLGIDRNTGSPEDAISSDMSLGSCWPMAGQAGHITVQLRQDVMVEGFSIHHVAR